MTSRQKEHIFGTLFDKEKIASNQLDAAIEIMDDLLLLGFDEKLSQVQSYSDIENQLEALFIASFGFEQENLPVEVPPSSPLI